MQLQLLVVVCKFRFNWCNTLSFSGKFNWLYSGTGKKTKYKLCSILLATIPAKLEESYMT